MNKLLCLIIALLTITTSMAQVQLTEFSGLVRHNSNIDGNPLRIESEIGENWNSIDNVNGQIGYWGVFSNHQDMDFGTEGGNVTGRVHLVIQAVPKLTVAADGDVGIGTQTPGAKLDVRSTDALAIRAISDHANGAYLSIESDNPGGTKWNLISSGSGAGEGPGKLLFHDNNNGVRMTIDDVGMVGIGTFAPNDALDVIGNIDATGCIQTGDTGTIGGTCVSDRRYKKNIQKLDHQLSNILSLRPVRFDWKENIESGYKGDIGMIAQEVESVIPEMVVTDDDGYKRVRYDISLQMRVISAMQEQQEIIDIQAKEISQIKEDLRALKVLLEQGKSEE